MYRALLADVAVFTYTWTFPSTLMRQEKGKVFAVPFCHLSTNSAIYSFAFLHCAWHYGMQTDIQSFLDLSQVPGGDQIGS